MKKKITAIILMVVLVLALAMPMAAVGASPGPLVGLWHFDGNADDSSGTIPANDGTEQGDAGYVSGMFDEALSLDGDGDYVEVADDDSLDITTAITIEAWINPTTLGGWKYIVSKRSGTVANYGFRLNGQTVEFYYRGSTGWQVWQSTSNVVSTGSWQHVAVSYTFGTAGSIAVYVNSSSVAGSWTSATYPQSTGNKAATANTFPLRIGALYPGYLLEFDGLIDEVRIWDEALDLTEIGQSYSLRLVEITKKLTKIEWGEGDVVIEDEDGIPGVPIVPIETEVTFTMVVDVDNGSLLTMDDVVVKDNLGGDLELVSTDDGVSSFGDWVGHSVSADKKNNAKTEPPVTVWWSGKTKKAHLSWNVVGPLAAEVGSATLTLVVQTDINPGGGKNKVHQEYTSEGPNELNSGATLSFSVTIAGEEIWLVLAGTDPIGVTASAPVLTLHEKDSGWVIVDGGAVGVLSYNLAGPTFDFDFNGYGLDATTDYSLIYYPEPQDTWPWPVTVIDEGTSDSGGDINLADSYDFGMDLTDAKIWLVLTDDIAGGSLSGWNPEEYLFEHHLISYTYTP